MIVRQRVREGRVLCAQDATWKDAESCCGCLAFEQTYSSGGQQMLACRPDVQRVQGVRFLDTALLRR